jgi:hypothetical protein
MAQYTNDVPPYSSDDDEREEDQREELLDGQRHRHKHRPYNDGDPFLLADPEVVEKKGFDFKVLLFPCTREAWRKPNMLHIFISFYLYMLSMAFSQAITPLVLLSIFILLFFNKCTKYNHLFFSQISVLADLLGSR